MTEVLKDKKRLMENLESLIHDVTILNKALPILKSSLENVETEEQLTKFYVTAEYYLKDLKGIKL